MSLDKMKLLSCIFPAVLLWPGSMAAQDVRQVEEFRFTGGQTNRRCEVPPQAERGRDGRCLRWYDDGNRAEEVVYKAGKKWGPYILWFPNGSVQLLGHFYADRLQGSFLGWFENGNPRFEATFDKGIRTGQWIRYHEKEAGRPVVRIGFRNDQPDGELWARINRSSGSGQGTSYEVMAQWKAGGLTGSFRFSYTDPLGHTVALHGRFSPDGKVYYGFRKNVEVTPDDELLVHYRDHTVCFNSLPDFWFYQLNNRIMPTFALNDCRRPENLWECRLPLWVTPGLMPP